jgi:hypothetical protein
MLSTEKGNSQRVVCASIRRKISETTINIKKKNTIYAGKVINIDTLVNKDFYNISKTGFSSNL